MPARSGNTANLNTEIFRTGSQLASEWLFWTYSHFSQPQCAWYFDVIIFSGTSLSFFLATFQDFGDGGAFPEIHVAQYPEIVGLVKYITSVNSGLNIIKFQLPLPLTHTKEETNFVFYAGLVPQQSHTMSPFKFKIVPDI